MKKTITHTLGALVLLSLTPAVLAAGVSVNPSSLDMGNDREATILVANPSTEVMIFSVFPDELDGVVRVEPSSFVLESGEQKKVKVSLASYKNGTYQTTLSVLSEPLSDTAFKTRPGVKIPLSFTIGGNTGLAAAIFNVPTVLSALGLIGLGLAIGWFLRRRGQRT